MTIERTLAIIKPDAWPQHGGAILSMATEAGLVPVKVATIVRMENGEHYKFNDGTCACSVNAWFNFYYEHVGKPFFKALYEFMASGPVLVMVLEGDHAISHWRELMGPTDSRKARLDTVRGRFGASQTYGNRCSAIGSSSFGHVWDNDTCAACRRTKLEVEKDIASYPMWRNAVHGSDSPEAAKREIAFFFGDA